MICMLTKEQIKAARDCRQEWVAIPEWVPEGETFDPQKHGLYVGTMPARRFDYYEQGVLRARENNQRANIRALIALCCCRNADGSSFFEYGDEDWLGEQPCGALD